jgi:hypothetical protein
MPMLLTAEAVDVDDAATAHAAVVDANDVATEDAHDVDAAIDTVDDVDAVTADVCRYSRCSMVPFTADARQCC